MGLLTWVKKLEEERKRKQQERVVQLIEERQKIKEELEVLEAVDREEKALAEEKKRLSNLKYSKWTGWLK